VSWQSNAQALISLLAALAPALVGLHAWRRRGAPGALTLATLAWLLALWALLYAAELTAGSARAADLLHAIRAVVMLGVTPLWLIFVLQYTGRDSWLTIPFRALLFAVPLATLALVATNEDHGLMWTSEGVRQKGPLLLANFIPGAWFWVDFAFGASLVVAGAALLVPMLVNSQRLYARQSLDILIGVAGPWAAYAAYILGLDLGIGSLPGLDPTVVTFLPAGLVLLWGIYRHKLLDISPVARDVVVEGMSDGTLVLDGRYRILDLNPSAARILGCKSSEVVGQSFREVMSVRAGTAPLTGGRGAALLRRYEEEGQAHEEISLGGEGGDTRHYDLSLSALYDGRGRRTGHLAVLHEATERKLAVERLDRMAHYDTLTGLPNRALFYERLSQEVARARRMSPGANMLALMFLDLDRFKIINDTLGHDVGDVLLREVAGRIRDSVREYDVVSRLAGDEFTVILTEIESARAAADVAARIIESISEPYLIEGNELLITTSVGICFHPNDGHDPATLVRNADAAMYRAKASGKNRYEVFAEDVPQNPIKNLELENELGRAIENDEFVLYYQPEIQIATSRMVGAEALIRWDSPERGLVLPKDFIPLAEETGHIFAIERWVLREACRQMRSWQERYPIGTPLTIGVNLSSRHFMHPNVTGVVGHVLEETGLPPESLVLEIKESVLHEDPMSAIATLGALKKLGVTLAVDNFGAGFSSLQQLKRFPLDVLKIDTSFIRSFHEKEDRELVSAVINLAHALKLEVVAPGVETPRQLMQLKEMGCETAQGHYFAEGLSHRAAAAFLVADLYSRTVPISKASAASRIRDARSSR